MVIPVLYVNFYATGSVSNPNFLNTGGLIGDNTGTVSTSYATGATTGCCLIGGLIGNTQRAGTTTNSYWDIDSTGQPTSDGGIGLTTAQLTSGTLPVGFNPAVWVSDSRPISVYAGRTWQ